ncbi:prolyl oligopeptidase family serine peptidase [Brumicola pallidula]|uniref:prolyl oligopeptidase n=1 Tax=Brumicola pallidula DSM 14239 = ACAM 615 TaxID=1121922 RepID=K6ZDG9_9ALTE|nr:prolyl oligopeptidase family serine peptidase [Glaciecola pallidula]GAC27013.1 prolyl oligopeptidase [Glaciecola pallidula DSM 14239 = ACAM 615]
MSEVAKKTNKIITVDYPTTAKEDVVDTYFGDPIADPYRWLENDRSAETEAWVETQNETTQAYLENIAYREEIAKVLRDLLDYERVSAPFTEGVYTYFYKNDGLQNQSLVYRSKDGGDATVFIDPNKFSDDGTISLAGLSFSADGSTAAYQTSTGGSDWRQVYVINTETKELLSDTLVNVKFSGLSWYKNEGIYYSSYDKPVGSELSQKTDQHKLYYHKIGTPQAHDLKVYGHTDAEKHRYIGAQVSEDDRFLLVSAANSTSGNRAFLKDLSNPNTAWQTVIETTDNDVSMLTNKGDSLYLVTNHNALNSKIVVVDAKSPSVVNWKDLIPETTNVLSPSSAGGYIFAEYMVDAISKVYQYDLDGKKLRTIELPDIGSAIMNGDKADAKTAYYTFSNYITPTTIYSLDIATGESILFNKSASKFDASKFVSKQVFYKSKDGTQVPMIITHHKDIELNGKNPTMLYGYGGFNVSLTPSFSPMLAAWLELGGVYAVPNIRGGGEYGKAWHKAGTQMQKQNVFDDFIAAAEYLIDNHYTSSDYLALRGGSNGGLLVGAVMTQRPDLAKVALPAVGVLDMLRYHTFTAGAGWAYDYGTSEQSQEMYNYIKAYSPVHNVKSGIEYPATMITTADHDDRVVPAHSFKFAAVLQEFQGGYNPILIRIETDAGHGAGTPISKTIEQYADIYGFVLYNMGVEELTLI